MIDTREELTYALYEAAELEHGLLIQYLFAAFSLKKRLEEGITGEQQELIRKWEGQILTVAREEMVHLGTVCNLLCSIGAGPHFTRPNFPQEADKYYPFSFTLSRFSDETLYRFIRFELPKDEQPPKPPQIRDPLLKKIDSKMLAALFNVSPDPLEYEYVGELYRKVREGFNTIPEDTLFIGPKAGQEDDSDEWSERISVLRVVDRQTANQAIDSIVCSGEGSPGHREGSHYDTFLKMRTELDEQIHRRPDFDPSRPVVPNPRTRKFHRDAPTTQGTTLIDNDSAKRVAELFNECYEIVLLLLSQLYSFGGEIAQQRDTLRHSSRQFMTSVLRPMAEILTEMPATTSNNSHDGNAGPTFELYGSLQISTQQSSRWIIVKEGLDAVANEAKALSSVNQRLNFVSENLLLLKQNIEKTLALEEKL